MASSSPFHCQTLLLLLIPPLLLTTYFLTAFPNPPEPTFLHPSLAILPATSRARSIYPEDYYPGGGYATFPYGRVRYWVMGPETGQKVVLIHGLSIPAMIWKEIAPKLASRGYRVLLYDLYGRGYSDAPQMTYDSNLYTIQLALLMQHLRWDKAAIVGVSMGGGIAAAFTAQFPHLVNENVVLIASAGLKETNDISRTARFMSSPLMQTLTSSAPIWKCLQSLTNSTKGTESDPLTEIVRLQSVHLSGYNAAISSSLREGPIRGQAAAFSSDGFKGRQVLVIHGTEDDIVPPKHAPVIISMLPADTRARSDLVTVEGGGHDLTVSHSDVVADSVLAFFQDKAA